MCIRDSETDYSETNIAFDPVGANSYFAQPYENTLVTPLDAVSYTHLRAHETVLDLVCRLLLEKKKKHINTTTSPNYVSKTKNNSNTRKHHLT